MTKMVEALNENGGDFKRVIKGSIISIAITIILLIVFSVILTYTSVSEKVIPTVTIIITVISILFGSIFCMSNIKKNGIINGIFIGLIYIGVIYLLSSIIKHNFALNIKSVIMIICSILSGAIGRIIGVNRK
jgi:hypothetical protein